MIRFCGPLCRARCTPTGGLPTPLFLVLGHRAVSLLSVGPWGGGLLGRSYRSFGGQSAWKYFEGAGPG
jgi:hypothetical protein